MGRKHKIQSGYVDARVGAQRAGHLAAQKLFLWIEVMVDTPTLGHVVVEIAVSDSKIALGHLADNDYSQVHALMVHKVLE